MYILTSVWVLGTVYAGQNLHFQCFLCMKSVKRKKDKIWCKIMQKNVFLVWTKMLVECFIHRKKHKKLKMEISISVWSAQHPKAGRNIQHLTKKKFFCTAQLWKDRQNLIKNVQNNGQICKKDQWLVKKTATLTNCTMSVLKKVVNR